MDLVHLQSKFFSRQFFFCILGKKIFGGKKFTLQRRLFGEKLAEILEKVKIVDFFDFSLTLLLF
jgi:hypothetical protein